MLHRIQSIAGVGVVKLLLHTYVNGDFTFDKLVHENMLYSVNAAFRKFGHIIKLSSETYSLKINGEY